MTTGNRLNIEQSDVNQAESKTEKGVSVKVMLSLFDVPQSAVADFDKDSNLISFTFEYLGGGEATIEKQGEKGISLVVGKSSGRLYGVNVALDSLPNAVTPGLDYELVINIAEEGVAHYRNENPNIRSRSFEAVDRVFKTYSKELKPLMQQAQIAS